ATLDARLVNAPQQPGVWGAAGMLQAQLGILGAGIEALETAIDRDPHRARQKETAALLQHLRRRLN
nr:hypothetical protein [Rhodospirillaceae bacterium]